MLKSVATKVAWVGRATSMVFGLALVLALLFGVASMASAGTRVNGVFNLGVKNTVDAVTQLVSNTDAGPAGPMLRVDNNSSAAGATGVQILTDERLDRGHESNSLKSGSKQEKTMRRRTILLVAAMAVGLLLASGVALAANPIYSKTTQ